MPFRAPLLGALLCALALAGCGKENPKLIPQSRADQLTALVQEAGQAFDAGECDAARRAVHEARQELAGLPRKTDRRLKANIRDWLDLLDRDIRAECSAAQQPTETPTATETPTPTATATPATPTPTPTPTPTAIPPTPTPTPTVNPGTGGEGGTGAEPPGTGGVPPGQEEG